MPDENHVINLDDATAKGLLLSHIRGLKGRWRVELTRYRPRRSDRQNRYYWPCFVQPFGEWIRAMGDDWTDEQAHEHLKHRFLTISKLNEHTGETWDTVRSTAELDTKEFNDYLDECAAFLAEFCGIIVPEPKYYHEFEKVKNEDNQNNH